MRTKTSSRAPCSGPSGTTALTTHHTLIRSLIARYRCYEVKARTHHIPVMSVSWFRYPVTSWLDVRQVDGFPTLSGCVLLQTIGDSFARVSLPAIQPMLGVTQGIWVFTPQKLPRSYGAFIVHSHRLCWPFHSPALLTCPCNFGPNDPASKMRCLIQWYHVFPSLSV